MHHAYWLNRDEFCSTVVGELARAGLGKASGLNREPSPEPNGATSPTVGLPSLRGTGAWLEQVSILRRYRVMFRTAIGWIDLFGLIAIIATEPSEYAVAARAAFDALARLGAGLVGVEAPDVHARSIDTVVWGTLAAVVVPRAFGRVVWSRAEEACASALIRGRAGKVSPLLGAAVAIQLIS